MAHVVKEVPYVRFTHAYEGITPHSSLLRPHAPVPNPLPIFGSPLYEKSSLVTAIPAGSGTFPITTESLTVFVDLETTRQPRNPAHFWHITG
jgi:hypothetical protein